MINVALIEPSFIIRFAMRAILRSTDSGIRVFEAGSPVEFDKIADQYEFDLVIADSALNQLVQLPFKELGRHAKVLWLQKETHTKPELLSLSLYDSFEALQQKIKEALFTENGQDTINTEGLSQREAEIIKLVASGLTNKEIADKLFLSAHTVITHRKNISAKLGIKTISGFTVYAVVNNLISLEELENREIS